MKLCFVAYKFGTEKEIGEHLGTYHYFIETLRQMARLGHEVYVIAPWLSFTRIGSTNVDGVRVLRYFPPLFNHQKLGIINSILRSWYISATSKQVLQLDGKLKLDAICVWQARETGYAVARIADKLRAPFIFRQITAWQWHFERMKKDRKAQEKFAREIYAKAKQIIFVSKAAAEAESALGLVKEKIRVMGVAIETEVFTPLEARYPANGPGDENSRKLENAKITIPRKLLTGFKPISTKTILFIGRINFSEKGVGVLLDAMPEILKQVPDAKLVIVGGGGEEQRMREQIKDLGIENSVEIVGKKPFAELPKYLNSASVMVVPSLWLEAFGQVTIEAMSCGVPVVTSDIGGSTEINVDGETGFIVPKGDAKALAEAVITILTNKSLRVKMGQAARKRVEENYSFEILTNKFLELIAEARHG